METIFYKNLEKHKDRLELYKKGIEERNIKEFDLEILSKLKKTNYGGIPGNIYIYAFPTNFETIGNKVEILAWIFRDIDFKIVHAKTNSTEEIMFYEYKSKHLDCNSWIEIQDGTKEVVIDPFSNLMIEKELYYKLENPVIIQTYTSEDVKNHPARGDDDFSSEYGSYDSLLIIMEFLEKTIQDSPYKEYLEKEVDKLKSKIDFDKMKQDFLQETDGILHNKGRF